jgi:hypothetical protein
VLTGRCPEPALLDQCRQQRLTPIRVTYRDPRPDRGWVEVQLVDSRDTTDLRALADDPTLAVVVRPDGVIANIATAPGCLTCRGSSRVQSHPPDVNHPVLPESLVFLTVSLLLVAVCVLPAAGKLLGHPRMRESATKFGIAWRRYRLIAVPELAAAAGILVGLAWRPAGVLAAAGMILLLLGALIAHRRVRDRVPEALPAIVGLAIAVAYQATALTS